MTVITSQFSLAEDTPQLIASADNMVQEVHVHNHEHSVARDLYVGPTSSVSDTNGHHILATTSIVFKLRPGDELYGMTPNGAGCDVTVLQIQNGD